MSRGTWDATHSIVAERASEGLPGRGYLPQLDGLRAIAILLVLLSHAVTPHPFGGFIGVDIFFVLSGYLITSILLREIDRTATIRLRTFYTRRMLRLYPPLVTAVAISFGPAILVTKHVPYLLIDTGLALTYLTPLAIQLRDGISLMYRQTWSLGIEEMFYVAWPAFLILVLRLRRSRSTAYWVAIAAGVALLAGCVVQALLASDVSYLLRAGGILIGCALALALSQHPRPLAAWVGWAGVAGLAVDVLVADSARLRGVAITVAVLASAALIARLATNGSDVLTQYLGSRPMAYLGRISYELYLWHYPVFVIFSRWQNTTFVHVAWVALPTSFCAAAVSHHLLTPRIAGWKRRFAA